MTIDWAQPLSSEPLTASPRAILLRALAAEIEAGAPDPYSITFRTENQVDIQLAAGRDQEPAAILAWARILGVTTVKQQAHGGTGHDRYSIASLYAGYRLEVWDAWSPMPEPATPAATHVPISVLEERGRGFDEPPAYPAPSATAEHAADFDSYGESLSGQ